MLDENDNDRGWKLLYKRFDDGNVYRWYCSVLKTSGHCAQDCEEGLGTVFNETTAVPIYEPTNHGVEKNDECGPEGRNEEKHLGFVWLLPSRKVTSTPYQVKHSQSGKAHGSIDLGSSEVLQDINEDLVRGVSVGKPSNTHQRRDLTDGNADRRPSHVGCNSGQGDELHYPATANEADEADDGTTNDGKC